jgi:competence protein ComEC
MFKWSPFPFLRIALFFIIGILLYEWPVTRSWDWKPWLMVVVFGYMMSVFFRQKLTSGILGLFIVILLGFIKVSVADPTNHRDHISRLPDLRMVAFSGKVVGNEVEKGKYFRYDFEIDQLLHKDSLIEVSGLIHLYLYKTDSIRLSVGSILYIKHFFSEIPQPKNPAEFNYSDYVKRSGVYGQCFIHADQFELMDSVSTSNIMKVAVRTRERCKNILKEVIGRPREQQIAQALLLGVKDYLDQEVKTAYASVGAMHVLAVSGLHVGIIYLILLALLKPLRLLPYGSYLIFILLVAGIWFYALITGFSPSVMRAATMFSVVSLNEISVKRANIYNSLGLAALVILLIKPNYLFAVGFQLSFIAVFGIVHFHPKIYGWIHFDNWFFDKIWSISCISIAAQLSTFPLSMYYFNQFPVYFLVSNLIVIPGAMILLILGLVTLVAGFVSLQLAVVIGFLLEGAIFLLNEGVFFIDQFPNSLITGLYITNWEVWFCYGAMILFFVGLQYRSFGSLAFSLVCLMAQLGSIHLRNWQATRQKQIVLYEIPHRTAIDFVNGKAARLLINEFEDEELELLAYQINPYRRTISTVGIEKTIQRWGDSQMIEQGQSFQFISWEGVRLTVITGLSDDFEFIGECHTDILILCNDAVERLDELPENLHFEQLIVSSDYSNSLVRRLQYQARERDISLHSLSKDGYWLLDLNKTQNI